MILQLRDLSIYCLKQFSQLQINILNQIDTAENKEIKVLEGTQLPPMDVYAQIIMDHKSFKAV